MKTIRLPDTACTCRTNQRKLNRIVAGQGDKMGMCLQLYNSQGGKVLVNVRATCSPASPVQINLASEGAGAGGASMQASAESTAAMSSESKEDEGTAMDKAVVRLTMRLSDSIQHKMAIADDGQAKCLTSVTAPFIISEITVSRPALLASNLCQF
jgi:hypothetical protein